MICETGSEPRKAAYDRRGGPLRTTLWLLALTFAIVVPLVSAQADLRVDITRGQVEPMPVCQRRCRERFSKYWYPKVTKWTPGRPCW